jgi:hypothetical protein
MRERIIIRIVPEGEDFILFFPDEVADDSGNVVSYMTIGEHGAASHGFYKTTLPIPIKRQKEARRFIADYVAREASYRAEGDESYNPRVVCRWMYK